MRKRKKEQSIRRERETERDGGVKCKKRKNERGSSS